MKYTFQRCGDGLDETWSVSVDKKSVRGCKRSWPKEIILGSVRLRGRLVDTEFDLYEASTHSKEEARRLLQDSGEMWAQLMPVREAYMKEEQETGPLLVVIGGVERTRWHTARRAYDYIDERLFAIWQRGLQIQRRAELSRLPGDVFHVTEVNEYGHARTAPCFPCVPCVQGRS